MEGKHPVYVGIDVGSVSANIVVLDEHHNVLEEHYMRTQGEPLQTALAGLEEVVSRYGEDSIKIISATGTGGKLIAPYFGATFTNEVIAQAKAIEVYHPEVRTVIEMGGQDAKLIIMAEDAENPEKVRLEDFQMNSVCAAGTGSFLDQQAIRMELTIEDFGRRALKSKTPPRIAGRCSVFAKSDMIHLQQVATPDYDIVAGLCYAVARNFKATIGKGKDFTPPVAFQGGVAANLGVRNAFKDILELDDTQFIVPEHYASMGALGAIHSAIEKNKGVDAFKGLVELRKFVKAGGGEREQGREQLVRPTGHPSQRESSTGYSLDKDNKVEVFMGLDIGSTSTNVILIDKDRKLVAKSYLPTAGRPLDAIRKGLDAIGAECADAVKVVGVGATGSGRYLIGDFVGADIVRNEITAQAKAAVAIDSEVDTIFEIGGQDSKYIAIKDGVVVDFEMNKVCAAGTGSFLEEQAERLGISIKGEFSDLALETTSPAPMGERCTVFIETDMVHHQQKGVDKGGLVSGLAYSIVLNYLNRVVGDRRIGDKIFFQGGTAANLAVVSAFEKVTGKKIHVPENHDVTGAIGSAILAMDEMDRSKKTVFKGFDLSRKKYEVDSFECKDCSNICEIRRVSVEGEDPLYYGGRCEKFDFKKAAADKTKLPDLFKEREKFLYATYRGKELPADAPVIGLPRILMVYEFYPFWKAFFSELGYKIKLSSPTNKSIISDGLEKTVTETCFPVKVAHGHIKELMDKGVKRIFVPSVIDMNNSRGVQGHGILCPYIQSMPYIARSSFDFDDEGVELMAPIIHFNQSIDYVRKEFHAMSRMLERTKGAITKALDAAYKAQATFREKLVERGKEVIDGLGPDEEALVIIGRPYNTTDKGINLELPQKITDLGVIAIPFDMLPVEDAIDDVLLEDMYWKSGQRILAAGNIVRDNPKLFAIYITNFGCGPDSFITHFFRDNAAGKPFLQLEIDEHSADAGAVTRCEAFLDSLRNVKNKKLPEKKIEIVERTSIRNKLYIPNMADGAHGIAAAFQACGIDAEVLNMPNDESLEIGRRYTSGKECYPAILTVGDMVKKVKSADFDPDDSAFFMPSGNGPCRFGQYNRYQRMILDELGYEQVPVYAPDQDEKFYKELGVVEGNFAKYAWWGIVAADLLEKRLREVRPYEKCKGDTEKVYWDALFSACEAIKEKRLPTGELEKARDAFNNVTLNGHGKKPLVGLVGEIYVRSNRFSNEDIVKGFEELGAEVRVPPVSEWIFYTNTVGKRKNWEKKNYNTLMKIYFNDFFQNRFEKKMFSSFKGDFKSGHELKPQKLIDMASPYIDGSFEGEAVLSVGKVLDYIQNGAHGIVNVMPFTCMPGTVVNGILKRVREQNDNIPYLNMVYEGIEDTNGKTRMEAFVHQAREFMDRGGKRR
ncbi:Activator of 2-hydroxyglutaryl-CoA dehydratase [hydrothermal vent metagenome]|uniref:Activator of 2-hydroxyglutaryl-CoA dehydratase n=1 Tax=hydrothermal vent metagenome TaxID=652676 RepID=A0A3B0QSZ3_9ZZZZ